MTTKNFDNWKPHSRYEHVYVVIRMDIRTSGVVDEQCVKALKVYYSGDEALGEVERLNELEKGRGGRSAYFVEVAKLIPKEG